MILELELKLAAVIVLVTALYEQLASEFKPFPLIAQLVLLVPTSKALGKANSTDVFEDIEFEVVMVNKQEVGVPI